MYSNTITRIVLLGTLRPRVTAALASTRRPGPLLLIATRNSHSRTYIGSSSPSPRHLCPGQKLPPGLGATVKRIVRPLQGTFESPLWQVLFTCTGPYDPVSTTNIKSFSEFHSDLLAREVVAVGFVPAHNADVSRWMDDINRKVNEQKALPILDLPIEHLDTQLDVSYINFPVVADPKCNLHNSLGFQIPWKERANNEIAEISRPGYHLLHIVSPDSIVRYTQILPKSVGFNVLDIVRIIHGLQTAEDYDVLIPAEWTPGRDALMPVDRERDRQAVEALKNELDEQSGTPEMYENAPPELKIRDGPLDAPGAMGGEDHRSGEGKVEDQERIPPGDVWQVLPYLQYVRIDKRVDNSSSVIGYQHMQADLFRKFGEFKQLKEEKDGDEVQKRVIMQQKGRKINAILNKPTSRGGVTGDEIKSVLGERFSAAEQDEILKALNDNPFKNKGMGGKP